MVTLPDPQTGCKPLFEEKNSEAGSLTPSQSAQRRVFAALVLLAVFAAATALALKNPVMILGGGGCPTMRIAGVYCPGCGSLRASHYMLTGKVQNAWRHNPLMIAVGVPCAAWLAVSYSITLITGRSSRLVTSPPAWLLWSAAGLLVGWGVLRNIPIHALDWTRPPEPANAAP